MMTSRSAGHDSDLDGRCVPPRCRAVESSGPAHSYGATNGRCRAGMNAKPLALIEGSSCIMRPPTRRLDGGKARICARTAAESWRPCRHLNVAMSDEFLAALEQLHTLGDLAAHGAPNRQ